MSFLEKLKVERMKRKRKEQRGGQRKSESVSVYILSRQDAFVSSFFWLPPSVTESQKWIVATPAKKMILRRRFTLHFTERQRGVCTGHAGEFEQSRGFMLLLLCMDTFWIQSSLQKQKKTTTKTALLQTSFRARPFCQSVRNQAPLLRSAHESFMLFVQRQLACARCLR